MALPELSAGVTLAVKNGPPGMWRSLGSPQWGKPLGAFFASPIWLVLSICVSFALVPVVYRARWAREVATRLVLLLRVAALTAFAVAVLVAVDLATRRSGLPVLVFVALLATWLWVVARPRLRRAARDPGRGTRDPGRDAEVVDLARWRDDKSARRHTGSR